MTLSRAVVTSARKFQTKVFYVNPWPGRTGALVDLRVTNHMQGFGLTLLAHSLHNAGFADIFPPHSRAEIAVTQAAQGAELVLKAIITTQNLFEIFEKPEKAAEIFRNEGLDPLFTKSKTVCYSDLKKTFHRLSLEIVDEPRFSRFGELRNRIQHLGIHYIDDLNEEVLRFIFESAIPTIQNQWPATDIFEFVDQTAEDDIALKENLANMGIKIQGAIKSSPK